MGVRDRGFRGHDGVVTGGQEHNVHYFLVLVSDARMIAGSLEARHERFSGVHVLFLAWFG